MENSNKPHIRKLSKQFELFSSSKEPTCNLPNTNYLKVNRENLINWRNKINDYQNKIIRNKSSNIFQDSIFPEYKDTDIDKIDPFTLESISLNFWRTNKYVHDGPAMYFVIDTMKSSKILLYIGETNSANKRWKGDHDCKNYINNYKEALAFNNLSSHLDIRFFLDVPKEVKLRRKLEKKLIYLWLPPFNKESRGRWSTTFTND